MRVGTHNGHLMVAALKRHQHKPVMYLGDTTLTGGQTAERISQYIQAFEALGAGRGTAGALLALNRPEVLFILGAGQTQGHRRTSLHPLGSLDDHAYVINDAEITSITIDPVPMFVERVLGLLEKCPKLEKVLTIGPVPEELAPRRPRPGRPRPRRSTRSRSQAVTLDPDHIVSITYTGGTTGKPKGVIGLSRQMNTMTQIQMSEWEWPESPRFLMCTPLSHAGAAFFVPTVLKGGCLYVLAKFDPAEVLRTIEEQKITATMLVPSMLYALMDHPDSQDPRPVVARDRLLRRVGDQPGAAQGGDRAVRPDLRAVLRPVRGADGDQLHVSRRPRRGHAEGDERRLASCGRPSAFVRTALLGEDGKPVPVGEPGEICVAGPLLAGGYWNLPDETAETFRDGWMHTGDVAREDEDGFWYIVDRTKDMIVTGGFNVFPREVEDVVAEHPAIAQVGVIGTPHEKFGEAVTAIVVLRSDAPRDEESIAAMTAEIQEMVKERKGSVQSPKQVIVADSLPLTGLGKPDKKALRAQFWTGDRAVG